MCGRMAITLPHEAMAELFEAVPSNDLPEVPNFNVCPTVQVPVVTSDQGSRRLRPMRWGWRAAPDQRAGRNTCRETRLSRRRPRAAGDHSGERVLRMDASAGQNQAPVVHHPVRWGASGICGGVAGVGTERGAPGHRRRCHDRGRGADVRYSPPGTGGAGTCGLGEVAR